MPCRIGGWWWRTVHYITFVYREKNWNMLGGGGGQKTNWRISRGRRVNPPTPRVFLMGPPLVYYLWSGRFISQYFLWDDLALFLLPCIVLQSLFWMNKCCECAVACPFIEPRSCTFTETPTTKAASPHLPVKKKKGLKTHEFVPKVIVRVASRIPMKRTDVTVGWRLNWVDWPSSVSGKHWCYCSQIIQYTIFKTSSRKKNRNTCNHCGIVMIMILVIITVHCISERMTVQYTT